MTSQLRAPKAVLFFCFMGMFVLTSCATYQGKVEEARNLLSNGAPDKAVSLLEPLAKTDNVDQLVYLFDYATALQSAGKYKESQEYFAKADKMADEKNYTSITKTGASLLLSEEFTTYRGEDYEKLLINVFNALNYLMMSDRDNALVEIRRLNEKLEYYRREEKKDYEQNTMALYLSALLWEGDKNWDNAYIDFERAYKRDPNIGYIQEDLVRAAKRADRGEALEKWSKDFHIKPQAEWTDKNLGELVLVYQQGWGPRKVERPRIMTAVGFFSPGLPILQGVNSNTRRALLEVFPSGTDVAKAPVIKSEESKIIYNVQDTSMKTLEDAYAPLIAKRIAAYIAKEAVANQVSKKNEGLGALLSLGMHLADRADLRQWSTLPQTFQVAKINLKPGAYRIRVKGLQASSAAQPSGEDMEPMDVVIKPRQKTFINWRSFH